MSRGPGDNLPSEDANYAIVQSSDGASVVPSVMNVHTTGGVIDNSIYINVAT